MESRAPAKEPERREETTGSPSATRVELTIEAAAYGGAGVARGEGGLVYLIARAVPGDRVIAEVVHRSRRFARARLISILSPSPSRQAAPCPHFDACGGCAYQNLPYPRQLEFKRQQIQDLLQRVGRIPDPKVLPTLASPLDLRYRKRMTLSVPERGGNGPGLHRLEDPRSVLEVPGCLLASEPVRTAYLRVLGELRDLSASDRPTRIVIQECAEKPVAALLLHGRRNPPAAVRRLAARWVSGGEISGVSWETATSGSGRAAARVEVLAGRGTATQRLADFTFEFPTGSFFQANPALAETIFLELARRCREQGGDVLELYSGVGALTAFLAATKLPVVAVEGDPASAKASRANLDGALGRQTSVLSRPVETALRDFLEHGRRFETVVLDPPRAGLPRRGSVALARLARSRILYLSCDPATMARDLREMIAGGEWRLTEALPVDFFPQTAGVECLAELKRAT